MRSDQLICGAFNTKDTKDTKNNIKIFLCVLGVLCV
jgi:hypothetical protein